MPDSDRFFNNFSCLVILIFFLSRSKTKTRFPELAASDTMDTLSPETIKRSLIPSIPIIPPLIFDVLGVIISLHLGWPVNLFLTYSSTSFGVRRDVLITNSASIFSERCSSSKNTFSPRSCEIV